MIKFAGCLFSDPVALGRWDPTGIDGVYAIQVADGGWTPKSYRPIYFGRTEDFSGRRPVPSHHAYQRWVDEAGGAHLLWASIHYEPSALLRMVREGALIRRYAPWCNVMGNPLAMLFAEVAG